MASAAVVDHLHLEALPLIDLRLLSQSELYSLSLFSSSSYSSNDNDDVLTPKIDRSVFNESAGSRKQTYSRLRLAPRKPQCTSTASPTRIRTPTPFPSTPRQIPEPLDEENPQIISLLKQLFAAQASTAENPATADDDDNLVSVRVEFEEALPEWWSAGFQDVPIDVVPGTAGDGGGEQKRKRGRPRKNENWRIERRMEHKAEPNVPVDVVVSEGEKKRKRGRPRKEQNAMIERRQSEREMAVAEEKEVVRKNENWRIEPRMEHKAEPNDAVDVVVSEGEKKRKRGRPRKEQNAMIERRQSEREMAVAEEKEVVMINKKGDVADVAALANVKDPYGEELKRRTEGLQTEADLLEFLSVLPGESMNRSRKRRIVLASDFGDVLPEGWKIMLTVKKRASRVWLHCRRYISPNGHQFVSCKEVSSYLLSFSGLQDASQPRSGHIDENVQLARKMDHGDDAALKLEDGKNADDLVSCSPLPMTSILTGYAKQDTLKTGDPVVHTGEILKCDKCTMTYDEKNDLARHLISGHNNGANGVITKDGKYECELCHKIFDERQQYNGHLGVHVQNYVKSVDTSGDVISKQKHVDPALTGVVLSTSKMHKSIGIDGAKTSIEAIDELSSGFSYGLIKADTIIKTCGDMDSHALVLLSHDKETIKADKDDTCSGEDIDGYTFENNESVSAFGNHDSGLKDLCPNVKRQCSSEGCSLFPYKNERISTLSNNWSGMLSSSMLESVQERGFGSGLCNSSTAEKTCVVRGNLNYVCTSTFGEPRFDEVNISGNNVITVGFESNHASQNDKAVTNGEQEGSSGSCLLISSCNEQCVVENTNRSPSWTLDGPFQGKTFESHMFASSVNEQKSGLGNNMNKASTGAVEGLKLDDVSNRKNHELNIAFDRNETGVDADTTACSQQERCFKGSLPVLSADEHRYVLKDFDICNSTLEELKQPRGASERGLLRQSGYEQNHDNINNVNKVSCSSIEEAGHKKVKSFWDTEVFLAFGTQEGIDADVTCTTQGQSSEGCSLVLSGNEQAFSTDNKVTDVYSSTVEELKHERGSKNVFPCPSAFDQIENKLNGVSMSKVWEWHRSEDMEKPRDDPIMIDFGDLAQSNENPVAEPMWRTTEQNIQQSGLANTSSPLVQSSECFPLFDVMSSKGGDKFFSADERIDRKSGLEGLRSSRTGNPEHNFLTSQGSSQPEKLKGLSYDVEMEDLDSSYWLKKEALPLLPKLAGRHQVRTVCVWCRNEFYLESVNSEMQSGSVGFMCATCNAKYSKQVNLL